MFFYDILVCTMSEIQSHMVQLQVVVVVKLYFNSPDAQAAFSMWEVAHISH